jgi:hypothetical protein
MHFQLTLNCKPTGGSLELVVFKLLLVTHDANNYEVHVCTETSSVVTNPPSFRLIIYCIAVHTTTKIFYIYHNKIFGINVLQYVLPTDATFILCLYFIFLFLPYMFRGFISPSSGVSQAVVYMLPFGSCSVC